MGNTTFYTKGDRDQVLSRIGQVHTITMLCPVIDMGINSLRGSMEMMIPKYKVNEKLWKNVPAIDALNTFLFTMSFFKDSNLNVDPKMVTVISSSLRMFKRLKYINFEFTDDFEIYETYKALINNLKDSKDVKKKCIYKVESLEFNLSDLFSQRVIDIFNKVLIFNDLMPNSYLERKFRMDFSYEEYESFINMFIGNNCDRLNSLDGNICDYFRMFPPLIIEQKPNIIVITNYSD